MKQITVAELMTYLDSKAKPTKQRARPKHSESSEQQRVIRWARANVAKYPALALLHSIPNGDKRDARTGLRLRNEGQLNGVPDLFLPKPMIPWYFGLYIEMKRPELKPKRGGKGGVSAEQQAIHDELRALNYAVHVAYGCDEAITIIENYLRAE